MNANDVITLASAVSVRTIAEVAESRNMSANVIRHAITVSPNISVNVSLYANTENPNLSVGASRTTTVARSRNVIVTVNVDAAAAAAVRAAKARFLHLRYS